MVKFNCSFLSKKHKVQLGKDGFGLLELKEFLSKKILFYCIAISILPENNPDQRPRLQMIIQNSRLVSASTKKIESFEWT